MLKDRFIEFERLKNDILVKEKRTQHNIRKNVKHNNVRCDVCKNDIHRAFYSRHFRNKKHFENVIQNKVIFPRKAQ